MAAEMGALLYLLHLIAVATCAMSNNIDTKQPILRFSPDAPVQTNAYFGYSLVLHQIGQVTEGDRVQALIMSRIVVSAPGQTIPTASVNNTGAVYTCEVNRGVCSPSSFIKLYDTQANEADENKQDQFLGGSMASYGGNIVVCAHRHVSIRPNVPNLLTGKCFASTNRDLSSFQTLEPCNQEEYYTSAVCQVGTSAVVTDGPVYGLGASGFNGWRGTIFRYNANNVLRKGSGDLTGVLSYQGYAMVSGRFITENVVDYAISLPRLNAYLGAVNIIANSESLSVTSQASLRGTQMGEYYGFALLSADFNGDNLDELLVAAPLYRANASQPETGRVYLYLNTAGSLSLVRTIEGFQGFSRFGYAMANLGDINGDGADDIAISAPFSSGNDSGTVYIYHSTGTSQLLSTSYQQKIVGSELPITGSSLTGLTGFGTALASGVDVDENSYNDLAIGSFTSQQVFLLRTRPLALVTTSIVADPQIVNLTSLNCMLGSEMLPCFNLSVCARYEGKGLQNELPFVFNIDTDTRNIEKRLIFSDRGNTISESINVSLSLTTPVCRTYVTYVMADIVDRFNPFILEFNVEIPVPEIVPGDGNEVPFDFRNNPVVSLSGSRELQIETLKDCNGMRCVPDLRISAASSTAIFVNGTSVETNVITVGGVRNILISTTVRNDGEDAFQASITIAAPTADLEIGRIFGVFGSKTNRESLTCSPFEQNTNTGTTSTTCFIGNPLSGPGDEVLVLTTIVPRSNLLGNEAPLTVDFSVTSINEEASTTLSDGSNTATFTVMVNAIADVTLDNPGLVTPEQLSYANFASNASITNVTQLGPSFAVSFVVRNTGPSTVRDISLVINWPFNGTNSNNFFYLYPAMFITSGTGATVTCSNANINPQNYFLPNANDNSDQEGVIVIVEGKKRRKRSAPQRGRNLRKREEVIEMQTTSNQTISCAEAGPVLNCLPITCSITRLQGSSNAQAAVQIVGYIDERLFSSTNDRFLVMPSAAITIKNADYLIQRNPDVGKQALATVRIIPAGTVITPGERRSIPWWAILIPIVAAIIIVAVIASILWALGFFKRNKHEELKQRKEELQNLEEHGQDGGGSTENMLAGEGSKL